MLTRCTFLVTMKLLNLPFQYTMINFGIKIFNHLPTSIKKTSLDINQFRSVLKMFLNTNTFYWMEEYFAWNSNRDLGLM